MKNFKLNRTPIDIGVKKKHLFLKSLLIAIGLLVAGINTAWGASGTIYVTPANMYGGAWDYSNSEVRIGYEFNSDNGDQWTGEVTMTLTDYTFHNYPVYSKTISSSTNYANIYFYHYKNGSKVDKSDYHVTNGWIDFSGCLNNMYNGYHNSTHEWLATSEFDANTEVTIYYAYENTNDYTIKANMRISNDYDVWRTYTMTSTGHMIGNKTIYKCTFNDFREHLYTLQFQRHDGSGFVSQDQPINNSWTAMSNYGSKMYNGSSWVAYQYDVTLDQQSGSGGTPSITATCGSVMPGSKTAPSRTGYTFGGYYTEEDGGGTQYYTSSMTSANNWPSDGTGPNTLYAKWTPKTTTITLNKNAQGGSTVTGPATITATYDAAIPDFTALSSTNDYALTGYWSASSDGTKVINADGTGVANVTISTVPYTGAGGVWKYDGSSLDLYAQWSLDRTLTYDGNGESSGNVPASPTSYANGTEVTVLGNVDANPLVKTGYTFTGWNTAENGSGAGYVADDKITMDANYTLHAQWSEKTVTLTPSINSVGSTAGYSVTGGGTVGIATTVDLSTSSATYGYSFTGWVLSSNLTIVSGSTTSTSITVRTNGDGEAVSAQAVYAEVLTTGWYLSTDAFDAGTWKAQKTEFLKKTGESTGKIAYVSYNLDRAGTYPTNNQFRFKIYDSNEGGTWGKVGQMKVTDCTDWALEDVSSKDVTTVNVNVTGTYDFKLDYDEMTISIIYPIVNQLQVYTTTGSDEATIVQDYNWTLSAGVYSQELDLQAAKTYTFKVVKNSVHYGVSTTLSASNKSATVTTDGGDISLTTTVAGTYTISYNPTTDQVSVSLNDESLTTVTVEYGWGGLTKNVSVGAFTYPTITATVPEGMNFDSWTHTGTVTYGSSTSSETTITSATSGAKVTATFNSNKVIYFDNSASNWDDSNGIWVYLFSSTYGVWYDDEVYGGVHPGENRLEYGRMTRIGTSKIYYYKYSTNTTIAGVAFTKADQHNYTAFNGTSAAWLTSFNTCQPCYIASYVYTSKNGVGYHSTGYWKKYGTYDSGFSLWIYYNGLYHENKFTTTDPTSFVYTTSDELTSAGSAYNYHVTRCAGSNLRRKDYNGAIAASDSDYPRELIDNASDGTITTSSAGEYNFTLDLSGDHIYMYTEYPLNIGDYRVVLNNGSKNHPSGRIIRAKAESVSDTVSFFVDKDATNTLHVDTCKSTYPSVTWMTIADVPASQLSLNTSPYNTTTGVYNFKITHSNHKNVSLSTITDDKQVYSGNYYIRTDAADGRWKTYMTTPDNKMQHSAKSLNTEAQYDYYFTKYILKDANVQFTIANDYSPCIADTLYGDTYTGGADESHQTLLKDANVRFMWNSGTNTISRAYLDPATVEGSHFIELHSSDGKLFSSSATDDTHGAPLTSIVFTDTKNWIYQADVKALPNAVATLTAEYNDNNIDIISGGSEQKLFGGDDTDNVTLYPLRMVYDFKTNILVSAWIAETNQAIDATNLALDADLMIVRKLQQPAAQITFTTGSLSDVKTIYGALRFDYDDMVGNLSSWTGNYGKLIYDVSFPFDVNVKDIFGFGNMDDHWVVQKYNGARRAKEGWHQESKPFWETLTEDSVMHAYEGYTVIIDRPSFNSSTSVVWQNKEEGSSVYLYFPSASVDKKTISKGSVTLHLDSLNCKKDQWFTDPTTSQRLNHKFTDSNWRMLGVPLLSDTTGNFSSLFKSIVDYTDENPFGYLYTWSIYDNSYSITSTADFTFKSMHSYMVQFAGDVTFKGSYVHAQGPSRIVAAKQAEDERQYIIELQMRNAHNADIHTYVELRENACDTFALNEDVYMVRSSSVADLYTFAGAYDVAANVLSVGNHIIPVGMDVKQSGAYTFSMPNNFKGTVTLVDTYANTRTNLSLDEYEVYLNQGAINDRFYLDIDIQEIVTSLENIDGNNSINDGGAHKFLQNGQMYILKNGVIFDARGNRVK